MVLTVLLLGSTLVLARTIGGAKNWIDLVFLPSAERVCQGGSSWFPPICSPSDKVRQMGPYILYAALCVVILLLERTWGRGCHLAGTFIIVFFTATGRVFLDALGVGVFAGGAYGSYKLFSHVRTRVQVWKDPRSTYDTDGYQIVQGLMALASGGLFGVGLGEGVPGVIPASHTDYIFTVIGEEFGIIFGIFIIIFYLVFIVRGILIALNAESRHDALLVFGCTAMLSLQSFIIIGGVIKLIPLTGITLPSSSYGGSFLSSVIQLSIIQAVSIKNGRRDGGAFRDGRRHRMNKKAQAEHEAGHEHIRGSVCRPHRLSGLFGAGIRPEVDGHALQSPSEKRHQRRGRGQHLRPERGQAGLYGGRQALLPHGREHPPRLFPHHRRHYGKTVGAETMFADYIYGMNKSIFDRIEEALQASRGRGATSSPSTPIFPNISTRTWTADGARWWSLIYQTGEILADVNILTRPRHGEHGRTGRVFLVNRGTMGRYPPRLHHEDRDRFGGFKEHIDLPMNVRGSAT